MNESNTVHAGADVRKERIDIDIAVAGAARCLRRHSLTDSARGRRLTRGHPAAWPLG